MCTYCGTQLRWLSKLCFSAIVHWRRCTAVSCSWSSSCRRLTTAKHGLFTTDGELKAVKDNSGVAQCVTSPPNKTVTTRSKIDCMRVCITEGCSAQLHLLSGSYLVCVQCKLHVACLGAERKVFQDNIKQEAQLSQRGRAMLRVCL